MKELIALLCLFAISVTRINGELKPVSILALGRPFSLGDLYDRRRDIIVQGPKLWSYDELSNYNQMNSYSTKFEIVSSQSIDEEMKHFDLSASLRMSFLAGLITVSGSASYLDDRKRKNNQARVSLNYKSTTFKRELKPNVFTKVTYPDVLRKATDATDVVVAIQYGAGAIFTFDRSVSENERKRDIQGNLEIAVKKIPTFEISGEGRVKITEEERKNVNSFSCKFHGDFVLKNHPGTYEEAIRVYKELPQLLGYDYENSVPVKVWLYPIEKLPLSRVAQTVHVIKESLVVSVTQQVDSLQDIVRQCNDILDSVVSAHHERIRVKVSDFKGYVERFILLFKQKLINILPEIRKGSAMMSELTKLVTEKESSPFSKMHLQMWISRFNEEVAVLSRIQTLPNYCSNAGDFSAKLLNGKKYTLGLTLKLGSRQDKYLEAIRMFLITEQNGRLPSQNIGKWWRPGSMTLYNLQVLSSTFKQFHEIKQRESEGVNFSPDVQFLVREEILADGAKEDIAIELYNGAWLQKSNYQLTTAPGKPKMTARTHESVTISWTKPAKGVENLDKYMVRTYTIKTTQKEDCNGNYCKVSEKNAQKSTSVKITGLQSQTPYFFTISSYTSLGETAVSISSDQIATTKCAPGYYQAGNHKCNICAKGTYTDGYGMTSCISCPKGTYNSNTGASTVSHCNECPKGTYNGKEGSTVATDCLRCPSGTFNTKEGSRSENECSRCPKGTYSASVGQTSINTCSKCKVNFYNDKEGQKGCKACPSGMQTKTNGCVYVSECISPKGSVQVEAQLNAIKSQVDSDLEDFSEEAKENEKEVEAAMKKFEEQKQSVIRSFEGQVLALRREIRNIFVSTWYTGDGMSGGNDSYDVYVGVADTKEGCVYKCFQKRKEILIINGATWDERRKKCWCEKSMDGRNSKSSVVTMKFT